MRETVYHRRMMAESKVGTGIHAGTLRRLEAGPQRPLAHAGDNGDG
jgi:hypothetical protein